MNSSAFTQVSPFCPQRTTHDDRTLETSRGIAFPPPTSVLSPCSIRSSSLEPPAPSRAARECLSDPEECHQAAFAERDEDREDQGTISYSGASSPCGRKRWPRSAEHRKSANVRAFSGNDRATISTHVRFKAFALTRARQAPCDGRWSDRMGHDRRRVDGDQRLDIVSGRFVPSESSPADLASREFSDGERAHGRRGRRGHRRWR
jgi:hypothetical protein